MKYDFWDEEEQRLITYDELRDEKYEIRAGKDGFFLIDNSREDDDGYPFEIIGEWRPIQPTERG